MNATLVVAVVIIWLVVGLLSGLWMARHGHDPLWILIALVLGPLFVPIAVERVQRRPGEATSSGDGAPPQRLNNDPALRVLVGCDGSADSERALSTTLKLVGQRCGLVMLVEVVHFEAAEFADRTEVHAASQRLTALAASARRANEIHTEVLTGAPGPALRKFAEEQDMDLVVVGRRGRGLSSALLGSVSADVVQHSAVPVLVIEPVHQPKRSPLPSRNRGQVAADVNPTGA